jgi:hypothetical protein
MFTAGNSSSRLFGYEDKKLRPLKKPHIRARAMAVSFIQYGQKIKGMAFSLVI